MSPLVSPLIGYLIGSLPLGFLIARRSGVDLRRAGSGNVGAANVFRTAGPLMGLLVMLVDMAKGASSVLVMRAMAPASDNGLVVVGAGVGAVLGHMYPVWLRFVGGKGVAAACGVFAVLAPIATLTAAAVFVAGTWLTKYVSVGSLLATVALPVVEWLAPGSRAVDIGATICAGVILFRHRGNVIRLWAGTERRIGRREPPATIHPG